MPSIFQASPSAHSARMRALSRSSAFFASASRRLTATSCTDASRSFAIGFALGLRLWLHVTAALREKT